MASTRDERMGRTRRRENDPEEFGATFSPAPVPAFTGPMFNYRPPTATGGSAADPFNLFDDPSTAYLTNVIKRQIADYSKPITMDPDTQGALSFLRSQLAGGITGSSGNPLLGDFITQGRQRITELNQEPFSAQEEQALRTKAKDQLTIDRDAQRQMALEDMSRRGIDDSSGILQERYANIDRAYTSADAKAMNDLALYIAGERQNRRNQATTISQQLAGAGAQEEQIQNAAREASAGRLMQAASTIANLMAQQRGEARASQQQVLNLSAMLAQLPVDRLNMLMGVLNGTGGNNASSLFNNVLGLSNAQQGQNYRRDQQTASQIEGLAEIASYIAGRGRTA